MGLPTLSKITESVLHNRLMRHLLASQSDAHTIAPHRDPNPSIHTQPNPLIGSSVLKHSIVRFGISSPSARHQLVISSSSARHQLVISSSSEKKKREKQKK